MKVYTSSASDMLDLERNGTMVTREQVTEYDVHQFSAEASDLQLPVGKYPQQIPTNMGNGLPFILRSACDDYVIYRQANGCITLRVFND
jgi:hypothetical protein